MEDDIRHLDCPRCGYLMKTIAVADSHIEHCMKCGSSWFDAGEIDQLLKVSGSENQIDMTSIEGDRVDVHHRLFCPMCRLPLKEIRFLEDDDLPYLGCMTCFGILLDYGEFTRLKRLHLSSDLSDPVANP